jgi:hypothetical protein
MQNDQSFEWWYFTSIFHGGTPLLPLLVRVPFRQQKLPRPPSARNDGTDRAGAERVPVLVQADQLSNECPGRTTVVAMEDEEVAIRENAKLKFGLIGLVPDVTETEDLQLRRLNLQLAQKLAGLERYIYLINLLDHNETLSYRTIMSDHAIP